jgi:hypothetical protein
VALSGRVRDWDAALAGRVLVELGRGEKYWSAAEDVTALSPPALPRRTAWGDARNRVRTGR